MRRALWWVAGIAAAAGLAAGAWLSRPAPVRPWVGAGVVGGGVVVVARSACQVISVPSGSVPPRR